jgi:hypothetical protein
MIELLDGTFRLLRVPKSMMNCSRYLVLAKILRRKGDVPQYLLQKWTFLWKTSHSDVTVAGFNRWCRSYKSCKFKIIILMIAWFILGWLKSESLHICDQWVTWLQARIRSLFNILQEGDIQTAVLACQECRWICNCLSLQIPWRRATVVVTY